MLLTSWMSTHSFARALTSGYDKPTDFVAF
jgi:hypothetical protein